MGNDTKYTVYPDKFRYILSILVFAGFILFELYVLLTNDLNPILQVFLIIVVLLFAWQIWMNLKTILQNKPMLILSDRGIWVYDPRADFGTIPWKAVQKIETYPGPTSLQIGISVAPNYNFPDSPSEKARQVALNNFKRTGNTLSIDGFSFRRKKFKEIFSRMQEYAKQNNPAIIIKEYEDPILKRANLNIGRNRKKGKK
jgi:hypothetical protein